MGETPRLKGKKILIVDDEPDVLESLADLLSMCRLSKAGSFEEGRELLESEICSAGWMRKLDPERPQGDLLSGLGFVGTVFLVPAEWIPDGSQLDPYLV